MGIDPSSNVPTNTRLPSDTSKNNQVRAGGGKASQRHGGACGEGDGWLTICAATHGNGKPDIWRHASSRAQRRRCRNEAADGGSSLACQYFVLGQPPVCMTSAADGARRRAVGLSGVCLGPGLAWALESGAAVAAECSRLRLRGRKGGPATRILWHPPSASFLDLLRDSAVMTAVGWSSLCSLAVRQQLSAKQRVPAGQRSQKNTGGRNMRHRPVLPCLGVQGLIADLVETTSN
ncbi:uncharacterized protein UV8b_01654 [Ustilaginoidea virens]|uniref:Uncharacterized protein n=1 Tax=Ustilaginoidea virens TaxID=1159556 RepID=A0A8E5HLE0_USTVR|nr:uncharacterized protein UV8b_01654 [Ustilaginoidea virens]QUC17413.1 hypothetical protein UV8b_01654 [Ustilaginoidea virens]